MAIKEQNEQCIEIIARILEKIYQAVQTIEGRPDGLVEQTKEDQNAKQ